MRKERIEWIDTLKVFAIFTVILGHATSAVDFPNLYGVIYSFHMPLFFMISGYLDHDRENAVKHNIRTLMKPYIFLCLLYFPFYAVYHRNEPFIQDYILLLVTGNAAWFIPALFLIKIVSIPIIRNYSLKMCTLICILVWGIAFCDYQISGSFGFPHIARFFPFFLLGYMARCQQWQLSISFPTTILCLGIYTITVETGGYYECLRFQTVRSIFLYVIQAICAITITIWLIQRTYQYIASKTRTYIRTIAEGTIIIYVMHFALLNPFYHLFYGLFGLSSDADIMPLLQCVESVIILLLFIPVIKIVKKRTPWLIGR